ncbi:MAG: hypothetical protein AAGM33_03350 [Pseudomonadota bacterium]
MRSQKLNGPGADPAFSNGKDPMELIVNSNGKKNGDANQASRVSSRTGGAVFDRAEVRAGPTLGDGLYLVVSGPAAGAGRATRLRPDLNDPSPEYRRIEIVIEAGREPAADEGRYERSMPLSGLSGSRGVELVGSNGTKRFELNSN